MPHELPIFAKTTQGKPTKQQETRLWKVEVKAQAEAQSSPQAPQQAAEAERRLPFAAYSGSAAPF